MTAGRVQPERTLAPGSDAASPARSASVDARWWRSAKRWGRTLAGREALLLLGAAAVVQLIMLYRYDLPSHVVGGGAASLLAAAALPADVGRRLGHRVVPVVFAVVAVIGWLVERVVYGPFDVVDLAFTLGGAFVVSDASERVATSTRRERVPVVVTALVLLVFAGAYRYLMGRGAA